MHVYTEAATDSDGFDPLRLAIADLFVAYECKRARYVDALGVNRGQLTALFLLRRTTEATPSAIGSWIGQTSSTVTYVLDQLEEHLLITRRRNPVDRRSQLVTITDRGREVTDHFISIISDPLARASHDLTTADSVISVLDRVTAEMRLEEQQRSGAAIATAERPLR